MKTLQGESGSFQKAATHKLPGTLGGFLGPKRVPKPLLEQQNSFHSYTQHHSGCLHEQRKGMKWCFRMQVTLKTSDLNRYPDIRVPKP